MVTVARSGISVGSEHAAIHRSMLLWYRRPDSPLRRRRIRCEAPVLRDSGTAMVLETMLSHSRSLLLSVSEATGISCGFEIWLGG